MTEAQRIIQEMYDRGMTMQSIAAAIGRTDRQLRKIFHGWARPNSTTLYRLALLEEIGSMRPRKRAG